MHCRKEPMWTLAINRNLLNIMNLPKHYPLQSLFLTTSSALFALLSIQTTNALQFLKDKLADKREKLYKLFWKCNPHIVDTEQGPPSPIVHSFGEANETWSLLAMARLTARKLNCHYDLLYGYIVNNWSSERRLKTQQRPEDVVFMALSTFKHNKAWDVMEAFLCIKSTRF